MIAPIVNCTSNKNKWVKEKIYANAQEKQGNIIQMRMKKQQLNLPWHLGDQISV